MKKRNLAVAVIAAITVVVAGVGRADVDTTPEPEAQVQTTAQSTGGPPSCRASATVTFHPADSGTGTPAHFVVDPSKVTTVYPSSNPASWAICWTLVVHGDDPDPFTFIRLEDLSSLKGENNRPVLFGDTNLKGRQGASVFFNDNPKWAGGNEVKVKYSVVAQLAQGGGAVYLDPDIIIKKPGT